MEKNIEKDDIDQNSSEEFDNSNDGMVSTNDSIVMGENDDINMSSDGKRKAGSGYDSTEDGKKQRYQDQK